MNELDTIRLLQAAIDAKTGRTDTGFILIVAEQIAGGQDVSCSSNIENPSDIRELLALAIENLASASVKG